MLGKRKRDVAVKHSGKVVRATDEIEVDDQALFQKYFEAQFEPLPTVEANTQSLDVDLHEGDSGDDGGITDEADWEGLSDDENPAPAAVQVQVVNHATPALETSETVKPAESKLFMSSKPPLEKGEPVKKVAAQTVEKEGAETLNLKHDLDLQRLLKESHLLEQAKASTNPTSHRHKATDMRMLSLGSKSTLFSQEKMPISHRKGIAAKAGAKANLRRKEARENGIVLEKAMTSSTQSKPRRERGVDAPGMGKFRGGTLKLSKDDISSLQGSGHRAGRSGRRAR